MSLDECVHSAPLREQYIVWGVVWLTGVGTVISRRGAEAQSFFRGRCLLMNVLTLRPCASARTIRRAGLVRLTGVGTVISRRGAEAQSFLQSKSIFSGRCLLMNVFTLCLCAKTASRMVFWIVLNGTVGSGRSGSPQSK
jgi:predicted small integral membrane protein